jgi:glycosyltransferase involved in cell wall biosynthesis
MYQGMQTSARYKPFFLAALAPPNDGLRPECRLMQHEQDPHTHFFISDGPEMGDFYDGGTDLASLRDYLMLLRPEIVHVHHYIHFGIDLLSFVKRLLPATKIVMTLHEYRPICANSPGTMLKTNGELCFRATAIECARCIPETRPADFAIRTRWFKHHLGLVDHFLAPSQFLKDRFVAWGLQSEQIEVMDNGRPLWGLAARPARAPGQPFVAAFLGNVSYHKGCDVFLAAAGEYLRRLQRPSDPPLPELRFVVHGTKGGLVLEHRKMIDDQLERFGNVVRYAGPYARDHVPQLLMGAHCVVVPSRWWENSPLVIQEAFLAKLPVICSNIGGMAEKVTDRVNGLHFPVGDPTSLLDRILVLASSSPLYDKLVAGIPAVFAATAMADRVQGIYERLLTPAAEQPPPTGVDNTTRTPRTPVTTV